MRDVISCTLCFQSVRAVLDAAAKLDESLLPSMISARSRFGQTSVMLASAVPASADWRYVTSEDAMPMMASPLRQSMDFDADAKEGSPKATAAARRRAQQSAPDSSGQ